MLDTLKAKDFKDIVGTKASLLVMDGPDIELTVEDVLVHDLKKDESERPETCRKEPFTVVLSGPSHHQAVDGIYELTFEKIGIVDGVFVDNKSDSPESDTYNNEQAKAATEAFAEAAKDSDGSEAAVGAEPVLQDGDFVAQDRILYDVVFG